MVEEARLTENEFVEQYLKSHDDQTWCNIVWHPTWNIYWCTYHQRNADECHKRKQ